MVALLLVGIYSICYLSSVCQGFSGQVIGLFGVPVLPQKLVTQQLQGFPWMRAKMPHVGSLCWLHGCTGYLAYPFQKRATLLALPMPFLRSSLPTRGQVDAPHGFFPLDLEWISFVASTAVCLPHPVLSHLDGSHRCGSGLL